MEHTKRQLFQPFRFGQWVRLAVVGLLAGELSSGGGCNAPNMSNLNIPRQPGTEHFLSGWSGVGSSGSGFAGIDPMLYAGLFAVLLVSALVLGIVLMYISSVMRFVLFDSVLAKECRIRRGWTARQEPGLRYFFFKVLYFFATLGAVVILIGIPAGVAFSLGWFNQPKEHVLGLVLTGIVLFFVFATVFISMAVIYVLTKDFVVPQMALENIGALEGWQRLWAMMQVEKGSYAGYIGMKIVMAIAAAIIFGIAGFILALIIFLPAAGAVFAAVVAAKAAGVGWTVYTITLAIVAGSALVVVFLFLTALISVPAIVFFPAYSIYFFAARYPALSSVLYPAPAAPQIPPVAAPPPFEPPPLPPSPEPIG